jgi:hypothetical protein
LTMADERKRSFKTVDNVKKAGDKARFFLRFPLDFQFNLQYKYVGLQFTGGSP